MENRQQNKNANSQNKMTNSTNSGSNASNSGQSAKTQNAQSARNAKSANNAQSANTASGKYAYVISIPRQNDISSYFAPNADIPALKHFRLVHESSTYVVPVDSYAIGVTDANGGEMEVNFDDYIFVP